MLSNRILRSGLALLALSGAAWAGPGARAGVNYAFISAEGISPQTRPALVAGATYLIKPIDQVNLQIELNYCRHHMRFDDSATSYSLRMDYIRLPGMIKVHLAGDENSFLRPFLLGGGELAVKIDQRFIVGGKNTLMPDIYPVDMGIFLGAGVNLLDHLWLDLRLYRSAMSIVNRDEYGDIRNLGISLSAGINL